MDKRPNEYREVMTEAQTEPHPNAFAECEFCGLVALADDMVWDEDGDYAYCSLEHLAEDQSLHYEAHNE